MFTINDRQYAALEALSDRQFRERAQRHALDGTKGRLTSDQSCRLVDEAIALGERYHIVSADDLLKFIDILALLGPGFERRTDCGPIVAVLESDAPPWQRLNHVRMLIDGIDPRVREAAFG